MNIILEGPDNSGKTTLAGKLMKMGIPYTFQPGEGPPRSLEEINARATRYLKMDDTIFDRHPCISEGIYGKHRPGYSWIHQDILDQFNAEDHLIIYCESEAMGSHTHLAKDHDTVEHLALIYKHDQQIRQDYRVWAEKNAHIQYRIGQSTEAIETLIMEWHNARHF